MSKTEFGAAVGASVTAGFILHILLKKGWDWVFQLKAWVQTFLAKRRLKAKRAIVYSPEPAQSERQRRLAMIYGTRESNEKWRKARYGNRVKQ